MQAPLAQESAMPLWDRLAGLRFRLRDGVTVDPLKYRGSRWYLLRDAFSRQQFRLSDAIYQVIARMDGRRTLAQVCAGAVDGAADTAESRREVITALTQLQAAGMLGSDAPRDVDALIRRQDGLRRRRLWSRWMRLLSPRVPLFAPDRLLARLLPFVVWLFRPAALALGAIVVGVAALQALMHWEALAVYGAQRLDDPQQWLWVLALYPVIKALHELGHGFAARWCGAEVHEMGITFLVFVPVPYVDASSASALPCKYHRMLIDAAGIMVEIGLAAVAMFVWLLASDGLLRDAAFGVMVIGGVSTLLFNGNPLLRFDGYFVLADALEIPNLATRAGRYYGYLARRYLLGVEGEKPPQTASGERPWFLFYAAASTVYRITISIAIAVFLIVTIPVLGAVLATWLLIAQFAFPLGRQLQFLLFSPMLDGRRWRALGLVGFILFAGIALLAMLPVSSGTRLEGVILLPEHAVVRTGTEGFLRQQLAIDGAHVSAGEVLFVLHNPQLDADIAVQQARVRELQARLDALGFSERVARDIQQERLAEAQAELQEQQRRHAGLTVRSPGDGILQVPGNADRLGRYVHQGDMLAFLADPTRAVVRVVALQEDASRIRDGVHAITVRFADRAGEALPGDLLNEVPLASDRLPSAALGSRAGGPIPVDARDETGVRTLQAVFAFDIAVPFTRVGRFVGSRAYVRFAHPAAPLLPRWYDLARRRVIRDIGL